MRVSYEREVGGKDGDAMNHIRLVGEDADAGAGAGDLFAVAGEGDLDRRGEPEYGLGEGERDLRGEACGEACGEAERAALGLLLLLLLLLLR